MTSAPLRLASSAATKGRRLILFEMAMWLLTSAPNLFLPKAFGADHPLRHQHRAGKSAVEREVGGADEGGRDLLRVIGRETFHADRLERRASALPHLHLPGIELAILPAHGHQHQARRAHRRRKAER